MGGAVPVRGKEAVDSADGGLGWSGGVTEAVSDDGWGLLPEGEADEKIALCVWGEWFPEEMGPDAQSEFLKYVTDSVIGIVGKKQAEGVLQPKSGDSGWVRVDNGSAQPEVLRLRLRDHGLPVLGPSAAGRWP